MKRAAWCLLLMACGSADANAPPSNVPTLPAPPAIANAADASSPQPSAVDAQETPDGGEMMSGLLAASEDSNDRSRLAPAASGQLSTADIQSVVRQNFATLRRCYEDGLKANRDLAGKVFVKFTIGSAGTVIKSEPAPETTLPDATVVSCVTSAFGRLVFPKPASGVVTAIYPLDFVPQWR